MKVSFFWLVVLALTNVVCSSQAALSEQMLKAESQRVWRVPKYEGQNEALGWSEEAFKVSPEMQKRVSFWIDIYSKYSSDEGLLHDSQHVHIIYEVIDFRNIMAREDLTDRQKRQERRALLKSKKKEVRRILDKLRKAKSAEGLNETETRYWKLFEGVEEANKFGRAKSRKRLRFQKGQKNYIKEGIYQSGRYLEKMEEIFREEGLPIELTRLPFVESSFNTKARSKVGASGIWQFMRSTGRQYMRVNQRVDERNDPIRATRAAAKKMKNNYKMFENWPLAITAYNHGPNGLRRKLKKLGASRLEELVDYRRGRFGFASANFYASFIAMLTVEKKANNFFSDLPWMEPLAEEKIFLDKAFNAKSLVSIFEGNMNRAKIFNPHISRWAWKGWVLLRKKDYVRVPAQKAEEFRALLAEAPTLKAGSDSEATYRVMPGDTLSHIAREFRVKTRVLMDANGISNPRSLRVGQKLFIPQQKK